MIRFCLALSAVALLPRLPPLCFLLLPLIPLLLYRRFPLAKWLSPLCLGLLWGLACGYWGIAHRLPDRWQGEDLPLAGVISGLPTLKGGVCRFDFVPERLIPAQRTETKTGSPEPPQTPALLPRKLRLSWYRCPRLPQPGSGYGLRVRLKQPSGYRNPRGHDRQRYLFAAGIDGLGYVREELQSVRVPDRRWSLDRLRAAVSAEIGHQVQNPARQSILQALLVGDRRGLSPEQWRLYRDTGVLHLLVISGLHIGLVAGGCYWLLISAARLFPRVSLRRRQAAAALLALMAALAYSLLAGFSLPAQRALVMVAALLLGTLFLRGVDTGRRCLLALSAVLILDPLAALSPGFWLSFGATAVLLYTLCGRLRPLASWRQLVRVQLAVMTVIVPISAWNFFQSALAAPLINLLAVPVVSLIILPLAMLSLLLTAVVPDAGGLGLRAAGWLLEQGSNWLALAELGIGYLWQPPALSLVGVALALAGSAILLMPAALPGRWLGVLCWLPLLLGQDRRPGEGEFRATVLDVGQGLAVYVETARHNLLFDTGPGYRSGFSAAEAVILPFLRGRGHRRLSRLVVSHGDNDHAGGLGALRNQIGIDELITGSEKLGGDLSRCRRGQQWFWDGVRFRVLHPPDGGWRSENNRSCVIRIDSPAGSMLLTADIEAEVEAELLARNPGALSSDVLIVPHHGSLSSSGGKFIDRVGPSIAVISSGYRNSFGHPHPQVVARYRQRGVRLLNTADTGAVRFSFVDDRGPEVTVWQQQYGRYWWNGQRSEAADQLRWLLTRLANPV